ncbi:glycine zipper family protein [Pseudanabaena sp. UWO311]|uniref:glycine zipper family protein n=1 Tax=Pseudanabaena sp. UWO311 TaxID=2487337 RepID=UPI0011595E8C|nr:glycine zipper family protein [Pseudanabaena sp. UWO311]TYQ24807.1 glycine zipper family protein [Pseudanabaena sp. UWO311]
MANTEQERENAQEDCSKMALSIIRKFIEETQKEFEIAVNIKHSDIQEVISANDFNITHISNEAASKTAIFSGLGAVIGSAVPLVGTAIGAVTGSLIGAGIGYLTTKDTKIEVNLSSANLNCISSFCLAYLSACLFCGYAKYGYKIEDEYRRQLDWHKIKTLLKNTTKYCSEKNNLIELSEEEMVTWCNDFLVKL